MIFIVPIFIMLLAIYCIQPESANSKIVMLFGNEVLIWQMYFYTLIYSMLASTFFVLMLKSVLRSLRFVYFCGFVVMVIYTLFNLLMYLNEPDVIKILKIINSQLWGGVCYASMLLLLVSILIYVHHGRRR